MAGSSLSDNQLSQIVEQTMHGKHQVTPEQFEDVN